MTEVDYQILRLTDLFYNAYPNPPCTEILEKRARAYNCLLFQSSYDYFICIPFRSEITHKYAYHFKKSKRSLRHKSGLDYTKIVIISKTEYVDSVDAIIDKDEYNELMKNLGRIFREAFRFVEDYVLHMTNQKTLHSAEYTRRYCHSALQYFHNELGI